MPGISLELELFGEESPDEEAPDESSPKAAKSGLTVASDEPQTVTEDAKLLASTSKKRKHEEGSDTSDSKGSPRDEHDVRPPKWAPFQVSDDPNKIRQTNTGKDIPTNAQLIRAYTTDTVETEFDDHTQLRAWLKIQHQPSRGKFEDLAVRVGEYIKAHGQEIDHWYGTVKTVQKKAPKPKKQQAQTKDDILAAAQKAFEEANRPSVPTGGTKSEKFSGDTAREAAKGHPRRKKVKHAHVPEGDPSERPQ
ncbi:hypothetical protein CB0940_10665 [Cercospora beticola]|uniref:Uncharacterized protein n=1 Tax=Cercospora beticola TaxID=122368 RepID=A0A2G5HVA7_CERBT|nr:hypothetical protein CB0940_10665 [Cercospora beticola]PIA96172.1 hypothetical protein CB0940_10665 [Cercospora beticola]WPB07392.1 hypothetical protein RHO25_012053 [Cercospora beticola]CAK1367374.1 unnamed protein product [Cercospora beticola]